MGNVGNQGWKIIATIPTLQSSADPNYVLRFASDMSNILVVGQKMKLTQNGANKFFIIVKIGAYAGGVQDVTVYGGTEYDMENTSTYPVTNPKFSEVKCPVDFPMEPAKWTIQVTDTVNRTKTTPTINVWYNISQGNITIPIGLWKFEAFVCQQSNANQYNHIAWSTANNSASDSELRSFLVSVVGEAKITKFLTKFLLLTAETVYYMNVMASSTSPGTIEVRGDHSPTIVRAVCAYL
jgi:hypothetical protein